MAFFTSAVGVLQTLVIALGAGLGIWGVINLLEGYGNDNPGAKSQGMKQLIGDCLECLFPFLGVRFLSINDNYDSDDYKGTTGGLDVVMRNIVYAAYSKDLSMKTTTAKVQMMKQGKRDESEWFKIPDFHPAIVSMEVFEQVQSIFPRQSSVKRNVNMYPLRGKVYCGCCRHAMARMYKNPTFVCQYSRHHEHLECRLHSVLESELEQVIYTTAEKQAQVILGIDSFADMSKLDIHLGQRAEYEKTLYALRNEKRRLYEEYLSGKITLEGYKTQKAACDRDLGQLEQIFAKLSGDIELMQFSSSENKKIRAIASDVTGAGQLTRDLAELLIDKIYVYPDNRIEIDWAIAGFAGVKDGGMQIAI